MKITCPHCGDAFDVDKTYLGCLVVCGSCGKEFVAEQTVEQKDKQLKKELNTSMGPFKSFWTPKICIWLWYIGVAILTICYLFKVVSASIFMGPGHAIKVAFFGIIGLVLSILLIRLTLECVFVFFQMDERIKEIVTILRIKNND